jgi:streptogramin lyase
VRGQYADGCSFDVAAPRAIVIEPGHDAWVVGKNPAVLIEFDTERTTAERFGLPEAHRHD